MRFDLGPIYVEGGWFSGENGVLFTLILLDLTYSIILQVKMGKLCLEIGLT